MRILKLELKKRRVLQVATPILSLAGMALAAAPSQAQASQNSNCHSDYDCEDYNWSTHDWCYEGQCKHKYRGSEACKVRPKQNCWYDGACSDGDPDTVEWCEFDNSSNWWNWWKPGKCYSAPADGSACEGQGRRCRVDWECADGDTRTKNWCFNRRCYQVDRDEADCAESGSSCNSNWSCQDGDRNTYDWCNRGQCYHVPRDGGGQCEPGQGCDPADCPDDGNDCTQAACEGDSCGQENVANGTLCENNSGTCNDGVCDVCDASQCPQDDNPCTVGGCLFGICNQIEVDNGTSCGNNQVCQDGLCIDLACDPANCPDDNNECTTPACEDNDCALNPVADGTSCDNGDGSCQAGVCQPNFVCDPATCPSDGNECTQAACEDNACIQVNVDSGSCNNGNGVCSEGSCVECTEASQCNDNNECTSAACSDAGECQFLPISDGQSCNAGAGVCISGNCQDVCDPANCPSDGNACTEAICNPDNSCGTQPVAAGSSCAGGTGSCNDNGECNVCMPSDCADSNECTQASCNGATCENNNVQDGTSCNNNQGVCQAGACVGCIADSDCADQDACNGAETCVNSVCQAGTPVECAPQECKAGSCDSNDGSCSYTNLPDGGLCANGSGTCQGGSCDVCEVSNCDDQNDCTTDSCDGPDCSHTPVADGDLCANDTGTCQGGICNVCVDSQCDDQNECTVDACDGATCANTPIGDGTSCDNGNGVCSGTACVQCITDEACSDGDACNGIETCVNNTCQAGTQVECAPIVCQAGVCDPQSGDCGYTNVADNTPCGDDNGKCIDGACTVCDPNDCADNLNECTVARCDESNQCVDEPVDDGTACTGGQCNAGQCVECVADSDCAAATNCTGAETCVNNTCQAGAPVLCADDGNPCTVHACDPASGCVTSNVQDGTSCGTNGETCQAGSCQAALNCDPVEIVINHSRRGSMNNPVGSPATTDWKVQGGSYQIRWVALAQPQPASLSYHCFDLSQVSGTIIDARMEINHPGNSYDSADAVEQVVFRPMDQVPCDEQWDIPSSNKVQRPGETPTGAPLNSAAMFEDLNDGPDLAEFTATTASVNTLESVQFNPTGVANIQAAAGNGALWGIGGTLSTANATTFFAEERVFRGSSNNQPPTKLLLTVAPPGCSVQSLAPVDLGYYSKAQLENDGPIINSRKFESPAGESQSYPVGNVELTVPGLGTGDIETRSYFVFDASSISNAVSAKLRVWSWQAASAINWYGGFTAENSSTTPPAETVTLFKLDNHSPSEVMNATPNQASTHTIDVPIWNDLGDGTPFGQRDFTVADRKVGIYPGPSAPAGTVCDPDARENNPRTAGAPCGKWIEFELNADGVSALNNATGPWLIGAAMTTIDSGTDEREWTMNGSIVDLDPSKAAYAQGYRTPAPQLVVVTQ